MGYIAHHAIVVTSWGDHIDRAHEVATSIFLRVGKIIPSGLNDYKSFLVPPDGSKEGWADSDDGDERRERFKRTLRDAGIYADWVEIRYGGDDPQEARIVDSNGGVK